MDPIHALHEIAFELERASAPTFRVQAFRRAARVFAGLPPAELAQRLSAGTLQELPGIGPATASAMTQAAAGQEPEYLAKLLSERTQSTSTAMRAALRGDCHAHSDWSEVPKDDPQCAGRARRCTRRHRRCRRI